MLYHPSASDTHPADVLTPVTAVVALLRAVLRSGPPHPLELDEDAVNGLHVLLEAIGETVNYVTTHFVGRLEP